jgi:large subunit ribosomal protein L14
MIQLRTLLHVADNSGVLTVKFIYSLNKAKTANIGDDVVVSIKSIQPSSTTHSKQKRRVLKKGTVLRGIIIRTKKGIIRPNGTKILFPDNAIVLYAKNTGNLLGTRISGPVPYELRSHAKLKFLASAETVV